MVKLNKKADMALPFNFIFALILIVVFIIVAIYGINFFLDFGKCTRIGTSLETLQTKIDDAYQSDLYEKKVELDLPGVEKICFANLSADITGSLEVYGEIEIYDLLDVNTFLYPSGSACSLSNKKTKHIDLNRTVLNKNPLCFDVEDGVATLTLKKEFYDKAVVIK